MKLSRKQVRIIFDALNHYSMAADGDPGELRGEYSCEELEEVVKRWAGYMPKAWKGGANATR